MKIGFFDSGLGGLTILRAVARELPQYDYVFYGDTANLPYGDKTEAEVYELTVKGVETLFKAECSLVIIACNTASAETVSKLQTEFLPDQHPDKKILGVIVPTVEEIVSHDCSEVVVLATKRTVDSNKYQLEINKQAYDSKLIQLPAPDLVPLIELGNLELATESAISLIASRGEKGGLVVLGCTHYTEIKDRLRKHYGDHKIILSQDEIIPKKLEAYLQHHPEITRKLSTGATRSVQLTEHKPSYDRIVQQLLGGRYII